MSLTLTGNYLEDLLTITKFLYANDVDYTLETWGSGFLFTLPGGVELTNNDAASHYIKFAETYSPNMN